MVRVPRLLPRVARVPRLLPRVVRVPRLLPRVARVPRLLPRVASSGLHRPARRPVAWGPPQTPYYPAWATKVRFFLATRARQRARRGPWAAGTVVLRSSLSYRHKTRNVVLRWRNILPARRRCIPMGRSFSLAPVEEVYSDGPVGWVRTCGGYSAPSPPPARCSLGTSRRTAPPWLLSPSPTWGWPRRRRAAWPCRSSDPAAPSPPPAGCRRWWAWRGSRGWPLLSVGMPLSHTTRVASVRLHLV
eukprot:1178693-Prorocentrum_minimum.AAC.3